MSQELVPGCRQTQRAAKTLTVVAAAALGAGLTSQAGAGQRPTNWSAPVNMGPPINTQFSETSVKLTRQGRTLYFASSRPCGADDEVFDFNLWVAQRKHRNAPWEEPECLAINANAKTEGEPPWSDREPELSDDGHWLFFASDRPGSLGDLIPAGGDIWVSWRHDVRDDHGWTEPFPLPGLNTEAGERGPQYFELDRGHNGHGSHKGYGYGAYNGKGGRGGHHRSGKRGLPQLIFATTRSGFMDLWVVDLLQGNIVGDPEPIDEVNTEDLVDAGGVLSRDGLEMYMFRGDPRPQVGIDLDLYVSTRPHLDAPWSEPINLGEPLNSPGNDQGPTLSDDGKLLIFGSNREGSIMSPFGPSLDLWVAERLPPGPNRDKRPGHGSNSDKRPSHGPNFDTRPGHGPNFDKRPGKGPPLHQVGAKGPKGATPASRFDDHPGAARARGAGNHRAK